MIKSNESFAYIFSWSTKGGKPGLGLYRFNDDTGEIAFVKMLNEELSYGYATVDAQRGILYCGADTEKHDGLRAGGGGSLYAYRIDRETGEVAELNHVPSFCPNPSYVALDPERKFLVASMHSSMGNVSKVRKDAFGKYYIDVEFSDSGVILYALNEDGSIGDLLDINIHTGDGPSPRQLQPHAHCAVLAPRGDLFITCDKGNDGVYMYRIDKEKGKLSVVSGGAHAKQPGAAPRFAAFHPSSPFVYHNNEMEMVIDSYRYDDRGRLEHLASTPVLPEEFKYPEGGRKSQQDLQMDPTGTYLYAMLHGTYEGISVFEIDKETGGLRFLQFAPVKGEWARAFAFSPNHKFLVTACLNSGNIESFAIGAGGTLTPTQFGGSQSAANCVAFFKP